MTRSPRLPRRCSRSHFSWACSSSSAAPRRSFSTAALAARDRVALAFFCATELPLVVAITTVAIDTGHMHSGTAAGLVGAAILSTLIYPLIDLRLRRDAKATA